MNEGDRKEKPKDRFPLGFRSSSSSRKKEELTTDETKVCKHNTDYRHLKQAAQIPGTKSEISDYKTGGLPHSHNTHSFNHQDIICLDARIPTENAPLNIHQESKHPVGKIQTDVCFKKIISTNVSVKPVHPNTTRRKKNGSTNVQHNRYSRKNSSPIAYPTYILPTHNEKKSPMNIPEVTLKQHTLLANKRSKRNHLDLCIGEKNVSKDIKEDICFGKIIPKTTDHHTDNEINNIDSNGQMNINVTEDNHMVFVPNNSRSLITGEDKNVPMKTTSVDPIYKKYYHKTAGNRKNSSPSNQQIVYFTGNISPKLLSLAVNSDKAKGGQTDVCFGKHIDGDKVDKNIQTDAASSKDASFNSQEDVCFGSHSTKKNISPNKDRETKYVFFNKQQDVCFANNVSKDAHSKAPYQSTASKDNVPFKLHQNIICLEAVRMDTHPWNIPPDNHDDEINVADIQQRSLEEKIYPTLNKEAPGVSKELSKDKSLLDIHKETDSDENSSLRTSRRKSRRISLRDTSGMNIRDSILPESRESRLYSRRFSFAKLTRDFCGLGLTDNVDWRPSKKSLPCVDKCFDLEDVPEEEEGSEEHVSEGLVIARDISVDECFIKPPDSQETSKSSEEESTMTIVVDSGTIAGDFEPITRVNIATNTSVKNFIDIAIGSAELEEFSQRGLCYCCGKYLIYLFIVLISLELILGIVLLSLGLWFLIRKTLVLLILATFTFAMTTVVFITNGILLIVASICGFCGLMETKHFLLIIHMALAGLMAVILLANAFLQAAYQVTTENRAEYSMVKSMPSVSYDHDKPISNAWNTLQYSLQCCGIHGYLDWCVDGLNFSKPTVPPNLDTTDVNNVLYLDEEQEEYEENDYGYTFNYTNCYLLPGCCITYEENVSDKEPDCMKNPTPYNVHTMGCKKPVTIMLSYAGTIYRWVCVGGAILTCASAIVAIFLYSHFRDERRRREVVLEEYESEETL